MSLLSRKTRAPRLTKKTTFDFPFNNWKRLPDNNALINLVCDPKITKAVQNLYSISELILLHHFLRLDMLLWQQEINRVNCYIYLSHQSYGTLTTDVTFDLKITLPHPPTYYLDGQYFSLYKF